MDVARRALRHDAPDDGRAAPEEVGSGVAERALLQRIHNPHNLVCGCAPDCWCNRTVIGRAIKWWFNGRLIGLEHKSADPARR
jgi:hypothetical protein